MTFYACPYCRHEPEVSRMEDGMVLAECWCSIVVGRSEDDLRHRWNDLFCSNDPADGRDCL